MDGELDKTSTLMDGYMFDSIQQLTIKSKSRFQFKCTVELCSMKQKLGVKIMKAVE